VDSSCERGNESSGSIKCWETTEWLHNLWPLEWYSAPQSWLVLVSEGKEMPTLLGHQSQSQSLGLGVNCF
jgi:hypothetical protein